MTQTRARGFGFFIILTLAISMAAFGANPNAGNDSTPAEIGNISVSATAVQWSASGTYERLVLTVSGPENFSLSKEFEVGRVPSLRFADFGAQVPVDGAYTWEMRVVPRVSAQVKRKLAEARLNGDEEGAALIQAQAGLNRAIIQSGGFSIAGGMFVAGGSESNGPGKVQANAFKPAPEDQVYADDVIIQGSACVGLDCVNNESFGFDTIRLKENNTRIKFEDTSTGTCPTNDWQLTANDACPGSSNFKIEDITGAKVPFTITAGAATNSIFVDSTGRVGLRTSTPVLDLHIATSNTPAMRLEQNNSGGFTAQTWDVAGNEANFFVRDVTSGSRLPFRIRPGAPTSSIDISASGNVGVGTASPQGIIDVRGTHSLFGTGTSDFLGGSQTGIGASNGTEQVFFAVQTGLAFFGSVSSTNLGFVTANNTRMSITTAGNVGIGTLSPASQFVIANGGTTSSINAGATQFTVASSRTFKENIAPVAAPDILTKIESVPVVTYDFLANGPKDRMGLIAEDFYKVFGRGDDKHIDGQDVQMALWLAVQKLTAENKELKERLDKLEQQ